MERASIETITPDFADRFKKSVVIEDVVLEDGYLVFSGGRLWDTCSRSAVLHHKFNLLREYCKSSYIAWLFALGRGVHNAMQEMFSDDAIGDWLCDICNEFQPELFIRKPFYCAFCGSNRLVYREHRFLNTLLGISGHPDQILEFDNRYVIEYKSISKKGFNELEGRPLENAEKQIQTYIDLTDLKEGYIVYINKGDLELLSRSMKWFKVVRDEVEILRQHNIIALYRAGIDSFPDNVPSRTCVNPKSKRAKNCSARDLCWSESWK